MGIELRIKFTIEQEKNGTRPFMDIHIRREGNKGLQKGISHKQVSQL